MSHAKLPTQVPLTEVSRHTEDIVLGALGLPVGFDQERLLVNIRTLDYFRRAAGLDTISIVGRAGESDPADPGITGVDSQGTATMGLASKRVQKPLSSGKLQYPMTEMPLYGRPSATVQVDNAELETRIEAKPKKYKKGAFDVPARAKFLNKAIKAGLAEVNFDASFDIPKMIITGSYLAFSGGMVELGVMPPAMFALSGLVSNIAYATIAARVLGSNPQERHQIFREHRHSLVYGITPDRYLAGRAILTGRNLIKAQA